MTTLQQALTQAGVLATPVVGSNLTPNTVPTAKAAAPTVVVNAHTAAADTCAKAIITAHYARFVAWRQYSDSFDNKIDAIEAASQALQSALTARGFKRAKQEASEYRAFACVYAVDPDKARYITDPERQVFVTNAKGERLKDVTGADAKRRPTTNEIIADLRSERVVLAKQDKLPAILVPPAGAGKNKQVVGDKLTENQLATVLNSIKGANASQLVAIFSGLRFVIRGHAQGQELASTFIKALREEQVERGWVKPTKRELVKADKPAPQPEAPAPQS